MAENKHHQGHQGNQGHQGQQGQTQTQEQSHATMSNVAQMAKDAASSAGQMAKDAASSAGKMASDQAQQAAERVAGGMRSFAGTIRENAPEGMLGTAAGTVADTLESGGRYLEQEGFGGMAEDLIAVVRRHPIPSMLVCAGVGFLLGRMLTSSHSNSGSY